MSKVITFDNSNYTTMKQKHTLNIIIGRYHQPRHKCYKPKKTTYHNCHSESNSIYIQTCAIQSKLKSPHIWQKIISGIKHQDNLLQRFHFTHFVRCFAIFIQKYLLWSNCSKRVKYICFIMFIREICLYKMIMNVRGSVLVRYIRT